jgi:hypothetical protein
VIEYAPSDQPGANKRRSSRIVQAVPITVSGVDALGQPFKERTSTLIINCHGFKYQSKHYVLKGTTLNIEVPHPEPGKEPRTVQGTVTFVQRPRTVRELFQVGVELAVAGNIWGVAFPPDDWFPYTEEAAAGLQPVSPPAPEVAPAAAPEAPAKPQGPFRVPSPAPPQPVATVPAPKTPLPEGLAAEIPVSVARQWARMLAEAQQQFQRMAREQASSAVSAEASTLLRELNAQLRESANKAVENAAGTYADQIIQRALQKIEEIRQSSAKELREAWAKEFERDLRDSSQHLLARLAEVGEQFRQDFAKQLRSDVDVAVARLAEIEQRMIDLHTAVNAHAGDVQGRVSKLRQEFDALAEEARARWQEKLSGQVEDGVARLAEVEAAARRMQAQIESASLLAQEGWRVRMQEDLDKAIASAEAKVAGIVASSEGKLAAKLEDLKAKTVEAVERESEERVTATRREWEETLSKLRQQTAELEGTLTQQISRGNAFAIELERALRRAAEQSLKLDLLAQEAEQELSRRFESLMAANAERINRQIQEMLDNLHVRLQPMLDARAEEVMARITAQLEDRIGPQVQRAESVLAQMASQQARLDAALSEERQALRAAADEFIRRSMADLRGMMEQLRSNFEESCKNTVSRCVEEVETKTNEVRHETFESMYKSAEWYQKKTQQAMQAALDKAAAEAVTHLREKAAELSGTFAAELAHYSRSYVEHTQEQLEEATRESIEKARKEYAQVSETTGARFADEVHRTAEQRLGQVRGEAEEMVRQTSAQLSSRADEIARDLLMRAERAHAEFQSRLSERLDAYLDDAQDDFRQRIAPVVEQWRGQMNAHHNELLNAFAKHGAESVEQYRQRLEGVSNTCILAAVASLNQQCQATLESLSRTGEERIRGMFAQLVGSLAESLRQNLASLSSELQPKPEK